MKQSFYVAPVGFRVGLTSTCMALVHSLDRVGMRPSFFKPIAQLYGGDTGPERSTHLIRNFTELNPPTPLDFSYAEEMMLRGKEDQLMEELVALYHEAAADADVVIVEGLHTRKEEDHAMALNAAIAKTLNSTTILVSAPRGSDLGGLNDYIKRTAAYYGGVGSEKVRGAILNLINAPRDEQGRIRPDLDIAQGKDLMTPSDYQKGCAVFNEPNFQLVGCIPWRSELIEPRVSDIAQYLHAGVINRGEMGQRRVRRVFVCARSVDHVGHVFQPNSLLLIPYDRADLIIAACMASMNGIQLAGIVLTCGSEIDEGVRTLCSRAFELGLPVLSVDTDSYTTATMIPRMNMEVPLDDKQRINHNLEYMASQLDEEWLKTHCSVPREYRLSPAAFKYKLAEQARQAKKRIVLPEGMEPRTIKAAALCQQRGIAQCVLLAPPEQIHEAARAQGVVLPEDIEIIDPASLRKQFVEPLMGLRKHKNLSVDLAEQHLEDDVMVGTMMLKEGLVDGLVSGAVHTTASTIRPALQLIRTAPDVKLVSSIFFMCLPDEVVLYGDCAVNPDPDAEQLADIAIQSADTAKAFGLPVRVAMISYSTGSSGGGQDVEKVREAVRIARERRPDILLDGPLQYDAAANEEVAKSKAPDSPVAGQATVFIFPDLNTGNTTYKAVQRSASVISIGPMLQGLNAPVNDLSRGALVDDIVYTIAVTAIQAAAQEN